MFLRRCHMSWALSSYLVMTDGSHSYGLRHGEAGIYKLESKGQSRRRGKCHTTTTRTTMTNTTHRNKNNNGKFG